MAIKGFTESGFERARRVIRRVEGTARGRRPQRGRYPVGLGGDPPAQAPIVYEVDFISGRDGDVPGEGEAQPMKFNPISGELETDGDAVTIYNASEYPFRPSGPLGKSNLVKATKDHTGTLWWHREPYGTEVLLKNDTGGTLTAGLCAGLGDSFGTDSIGFEALPHSTFYDPQRVGKWALVTANIPNGEIGTGLIEGIARVLCGIHPEPSLWDNWSTAGSNGLQRGFRRLEPGSAGGGPADGQLRVSPFGAAELLRDEPFGSNLRWMTIRIGSYVSEIREGRTEESISSTGEVHPFPGIATNQRITATNRTGQTIPSGERIRYKFTRQNQLTNNGFWEIIARTSGF